MRLGLGRYELHNALLKSHYQTQTPDLMKRLYQWLGFDPATMTIKREIIAGITTFLTMAYILAVHPAILATTGMDKGALFTTTALTSIIATLVMAFAARMPFALAPAMGLNAFFAFTIVGVMGYSWQFALTAVLIEGLIFIVLTLTGLRRYIVEAMPTTLRHAISSGIGLFITFIGLQNAGIIVSNPATLLQLGNMHSPEVLLALLGVVLAAVLLIRGITGAILLSILAVTLVGIPLGVTHLSTPVALPPSIAPICLQLEFSHALSLDMLVCVMTLLFLDLFDTTGTLVAVGQRAGIMREDGSMPRLTHAFMADAVGTTVGALLGTSTVSTFVESASGVNAGGRSGLTALVVAACFALALIFSPVFLAIPAVATAPALIVVGMNMMVDIRRIDFTDYRKALPAFVCIIMMPFAASISDGILLGMITYVLVEACSGHYKEVSIASYILAALFVLRYALLG